MVLGLLICCICEQGVKIYYGLLRLYVSTELNESHGSRFAQGICCIWEQGVKIDLCFLRLYVSTGRNYQDIFMFAQAIFCLSERSQDGFVCSGSYMSYL